MLCDNPSWGWKLSISLALLFFSRRLNPLRVPIHRLPSDSAARLSTQLSESPCFTVIKCSAPSFSSTRPAVVPAHIDPSFENASERTPASEGMVESCCVSNREPSQELRLGLSVAIQIFPSAASQWREHRYWIAIGSGKAVILSPFLW